MIIFPITEGPLKKTNYDNSSGLKNLNKSREKNYESRISWKKITQHWRQSVPGTDETRDLAVKALAQFWKNRLLSEPEPSDELPWKVFVTIAREAIIDQLSSKSGLQLKLTTKGGYLYCRVRAPIKLLEQQAKDEGYRLQFRSEIDPGSNEFWNREVKKEDGEPIAPEIEEEKKIYSYDEANVILEKLYNADCISPNDLGVNKDKETPITWSRRIHALERIADQVPIWNPYPAYAAFSPEPHLRYLFQTYPSVRGKTLFRAKDRLFLTKRIIDHYFDLEVLGHLDVVDSVMALHDANRGEKLTIDILRSRWVTYWHVSATECGSPLATHAGAEDGVAVEWYLRPFSQPFSDVRDYFGEKIALYYLWFGHYTYRLIAPSLLGFITQNLVWFTDYNDSSLRQQIIELTFLTIIVIFGAITKELWSREEKYIALKWGTSGFVADEKERPQFRSDPNEPFRRSLVTNRTAVYFPKQKRRIRQLISVIIIFGQILFVFVKFSLIMYAEYIFGKKYKWDGFANLTSAFIAVTIKTNSQIYSGMILSLNEWENYRTETQFDNNLIGKTFLFEFCNNYGVLFYTAFLKGSFFNSCVNNDCVMDLKLLLYYIFLGRFTVILYRLYLAIKSAWIKRNETRSNSTMEIDSANESLLSDESDKHFMAEVSRLPFEGTFFKFTDIVIQHGVLNLFLVVQPALCVVALVENLIQIRLDAWNLCTASRRPHVQIAESVGFWTDFIDGMSNLSIISNVGLLCFTTKSLQGYTILQKWLIFLATEQSLLMIKLILYRYLSIQTKELKLIRERQNYIVRKYLHGTEDRDDDEVELVSIRGNLEDGDQQDDVETTDFKIDAKVGEENYSKTEALEGQKRALLLEINKVKDQLERASKNEVLNQRTGIGETRHGLSLGRLTLRLVELQGLSSALGDPEISIKVRVHIHAYRSDIKAVGHVPGEYSQTATYPLQHSAIAFNQVLGPFAPIKTMDADVVFDVCDMSADANELIIATASLKLRELNDQQQHDKVLFLRVRQGQGGVLKLSEEAKLFVQLTFQYSNIVPLRTRIYNLQDELRKVTKEMAILKSGVEVTDDTKNE